MIVILLQRGRTKSGRAGKSRWDLIGIAAQSKICEFEVEPIPEDNNISRFNVPVDDVLRLQVCSKVDKFNNKPDDISKVIDILPTIQQAMLKRVHPQFQQQSGLPPFLLIEGEGLIVIFEYLYERGVYLEDMWMV